MLNRIFDAASRQAAAARFCVVCQAHSANVPVTPAERLKLAQLAESLVVLVT